MKNKEKNKAARIIIKQLSVFSLTVILILTVSILLVTMPTNEDESDVTVYNGVRLRNDGEYWTVVNLSGGSRRTLDIPAEYQGLPIERIEKLAGTEGIERLVIPKTVKYINISALDTLTSLEAITVANGNHYYCSANGILYDSEKESLLKVPIQYSFDNRAFIVKNGIETIGEKAFYGCKLTSLRLSDSVKVIEKYAFKSCTRLTKIEDFGKSKILKLGEKCFEGCESLTGMEIPASVINIGQSCFEGCERITAFYVDKNNSLYSSNDGMLLSKDGSTLVCYAPGDKRSELTLETGIEVIGEYAFATNRNIIRINLPQSLKKLSLNAFFDCSSLAGVILGVTEPPETSIEIGETLTSVPFFVQEEVIYDYKFSDFWNEVNVYPLRLYGNYAWIRVEELREYDANRYLELLDCGAKLTDGVIAACFDYGKIDLPDYVESNNTSSYSSETKLLPIETRLGVLSEATPDALSIIKIVGSMKTAFISGNITEIDFGTYYLYAGNEFAGFQSLTKITFESNIVRIDAGAFNGCAALKKIYFKNADKAVSRLSYVGESAFYGCTSLEYAELPKTQDGDIVLGSNCFAACPKLKTVILYSKVTYLSSVRRITDTEGLTLVVPDELADYYFTTQHYSMWRVEKGSTLLTMSEYKSVSFSFFPLSCKKVEQRTSLGCLLRRLR